jgi:hypothetical protein
VLAPPHVTAVVVVPSSLLRAVPTADQNRSVPLFQPTTKWGLAVPSATRSVVLRSSVSFPFVHGFRPTECPYWIACLFWRFDWAMGSGSW